ncbi:MAG TPA: aminodeoxychorismate lyase [Methylotenera sp.]|nr:aminodeoxychorismate lyase [Methylotenera sp.]HPH04440.1 aminodeoxychorismate lyase [Methylotenera sp.]HPN01546.1 aminodeoxychorismate lyase [Methylotenera sp.]
MSVSPTYLINGSFSHTISPLDRGFSYGDGVFRTMLMRGGLPVDWPLHYQKLVADCAAIGIVCPSAELLMSDFQQNFSAEDIAENRLAVAKIIITRGEGERGYKPPAVTSPTRVLIKSAMPEYPSTYAKDGVRLHLCETRLSMQAKLAGIKHLNRLENVLARMEWSNEAIFDGLMLDTQENVIECTMSNIFARYKNLLVTPDLSQCGVAGVTRQRILGLANVLNLQTEVKPVSFADLLKADEVLICNSLIGTFQVVSVNNHTWQAQALATNFRSLLRQ